MVERFVSIEEAAGSMPAFSTFINFSCLVIYLMYSTREGFRFTDISVVS